MGFSEYSKCFVAPTMTFTVAAIAASIAISVYLVKRSKGKDVSCNVQELEASLESALEKCAAERQGRIRAQQALRKALAEPISRNLEQTSYPMSPIGTVQSCFSTRNGTPRQPLIVPLARACLVFDSARVPPAALEGLEEYSHCWIIYVFHLNTNLEKLWRQPSKSKFKAKVRVPRLKGGRKGVFATRSPHRLCPIGLTVAKIEAVQGNMVLLSGVDLVNGTPILDIKPYLPYCDSIQGATVPKWVTVDNMLAVASVRFSGSFSSTLADCWATLKKKSLYASPDEFQSLVEQVLSWDIRSLSQRNRPHDSNIKAGNDKLVDDNSEVEERHDEEVASDGYFDVVYHIILEGLDISYIIDCNGNVTVDRVTVSSEMSNSSKNSSNYSTWKDKLG